MPKVAVRVTTFNANQFSEPDHQWADIKQRARTSDIMLLQEVVDLDLEVLVKELDGWAVFQVRNGDNDGHANTAVMWRTALEKTLGPVKDHAVEDLGRAPHQPGHPHTGSRERFLVGVMFACGEWFCAMHIFRESDRSAIPAMLAKAVEWLKTHRSATIGVDRNQEPVMDLERRTGLQWHGVKIDGFLTHLPMANVREFPKGFSDHPGVHASAAVTVHPVKEHHVVKPPAPTYIGPAAHISDGDNMPIKRIVIHSTVGPCKPGQARVIARYFMTEAAGGSAQYITDPRENIQSVYDSRIAWGAPGAAWSDKSHPVPANIHSLHIEMCDTPGPVPNDPPGSAKWKARKRAWRWILPNQQATLKRAAELAGHLAAAYGVSLRFLDVGELHQGLDGITTHANVSAAFGQTTHWDPGFWPRRRFMRIARKEYRRLMGA